MAQKRRMVVSFPAVLWYISCIKSNCINLTGETMKYGESTFDIIYLVFAIAMWICILRRKKDALGRLTGSAVLILGCGDAFHLVPRVLNYFVDADLNVWLGFGKLVTSITMTVFYVLLYRIWLKVYGEREGRKLDLMSGNCAVYGSL